MSTSQYYKVPDGSTVPHLSLGEDFERISLGTAENRAGKDPAGEASKKGKVPTLGEVQTSLKHLIKTIIQATNSMDTLPRGRRFATFKLFYNENTPENYEPVHFKAGDVDADRFVFSTHNVMEPPEKTSIGAANLGHHGIKVEIQSVAAYLPNLDDSMNAPFTGTAAVSTNGTASICRTPAEEVAQRTAQVQIQMEDAQARVVVWDAEQAIADGYDDSLDAEGEEDPDYAIDKSVNDSGIDMKIGLLGIRTEGGNVVPISNAKIPAAEDVNAGADGSMDTSGTINTADVEGGLFSGTSEDVPLNAGALRLTRLIVNHNLPQTQELLESSQPLSPAKRTSSTLRVAASSLPPSSDSGTSTPRQTQPTLEGETVPTQMLMDLLLDNRNNPEPIQDIDMLDMETQVPNAGGDSIESFTAAPGPVEGLHTESEDRGLACSCGVNTDVHGVRAIALKLVPSYHSKQDKRLPKAFNCFECRIRQDRNWAMLSVNDLLPDLRERFGRLALFRRAIKIAETCDIDSLKKFTRELDFVRIEISDIDLSRSKKSKQQQKARARREIQKAKYYFVKGSKKRQEYRDYFNPNVEVERRMMGLSAVDTRPRTARKGHLSSSLAERVVSSNLAVQGSSRRSPPQIPSVVIPALDENCSQTQDDTQGVLAPSVRPSQELKRKSTMAGQPSKKKIKISMPLPVDLQD
ncbi:hypothetical protein HWV62_38893 [Athelia sp. TMB]|nr:hypothetical protein HWV62_38893 [Athelia sp. TMB]